MNTPALLQVRGLSAGYGKSRVLHDISFDVHAGEIVALLGRNGAGRSTTAKALMGLLPASGSAHWRGQPLLGHAPFHIARMGLGYVPESRDIFTRLSVQQNLLLGRKPPGPGGGPVWSEADACQLFPILAARRHTPAGLLSGGEQQMLALCRTLMGAPGLMLVDEPTEGLSPQAAQQVAQCLRTLRARGVPVLLIEQKFNIALAIADRVLLMGQGRIVFDGPPADLQANTSLQQQWLAV